MVEASFSEWLNALLGPASALVVGGLILYYVRKDHNRFLDKMQEQETSREVQRVAERKEAREHTERVVSGITATFESTVKDLNETHKSDMGTMKEAVSTIAQRAKESEAIQEAQYSLLLKAVLLNKGQSLNEIQG